MRARKRKLLMLLCSHRPMHALAKSRFLAAALLLVLPSVVVADDLPDARILMVETGKEVQLKEQYAGQPVLLDFWATWCGVCIKEVPKLNDIAAKFGDRLKVVGINVDENDAAKLSQFAKDKKFSYPVAVDAEGDAKWKYGVRGLPTFILVDANGKIARKFVGPQKWESDELQKILASVATPASVQSKPASTE